MANKLRKTIGSRDDRYILEVGIKMNKGNFIIEFSEVEKENGTRGYGQKRHGHYRRIDPFVFIENNSGVLLLVRGP
ncbi:hypothetical protein QSE00_13940 [Arenibacter sp. M-2]|uniref:hypothetical protein n=1 Tax=Arenibacter sp. M-2 TaxID=3053612 RepID=UPI002570B39E|nr:hypothetical protein [Arenibacter sp. M-2]MDL5512924.1 hypothetical protein [Arenibacter sp. M-2]